MNNCKITLKKLPKSSKYDGFSDAGVRHLFGTLKVSPIVDFDRQDLESYPTSHNGKMSISGFQPKMSATVIDDKLVLVKENGTFIIKPSPAQFPNLAENEHAIMTLASICKFPVPPMSALFEVTGIPGERVVNEYGMTELLSQMYEPILTEGPGAAGTHIGPPWLRVRALDPLTLEELPSGEEGLLAFFDLANIGSVCHILTEDLGSVIEGRVHLVGRVLGAEPRGCSRAMDELMLAANAP